MEGCWFHLQEWPEPLSPANEMITLQTVTLFRVFLEKINYTETESDFFPTLTLNTYAIV